MRVRGIAIFTLLLPLLISGCGQKGPLYREQGLSKDALQAVGADQSKADQKQDTE